MIYEGRVCLERGPTVGAEVGFEICVNRNFVDAESGFAGKLSFTRGCRDTVSLCNCRSDTFVLLILNKKCIYT